MKRHIAANRNKPKYRLSPTVLIALATHQPLKKVGTVGGDPPQRSEQSAATRRKGRNSQRRPAANCNKSKYRLSPTVSIALATRQPLKRSEFEAAHCRKGRNLRRHIAAKVGTVSSDPPQIAISPNIVYPRPSH